MVEPLRLLHPMAASSRAQTDRRRCLRSVHEHRWVQKRQMPKVFNMISRNHVQHTCFYYFDSRHDLRIRLTSPSFLDMQSRERQLRVLIGEIVLLYYFMFMNKHESLQQQNLSIMHKVNSMNTESWIYVKTFTCNLEGFPSVKDSNSSRLNFKKSE